MSVPLAARVLSGASKNCLSVLLFSWRPFSRGGARVSFCTYHFPMKPSYLAQRLPAGAPDVLEETVALGQAVDGVVALTHGADEAAEGVGLVLAGVAAVLVDLADGDLDGGVVLGLDDAVGGRALAGDVAERSRNC